MTSKVPIRKFVAPLDLTNFRLKLGDEEYLWYREKMEENKIFEAQMIEIINFMNGRRTCEDVYKAITAEYGDIDVKDLMKFLKDLEKIGFIELRKVS